MNNSIIIRARAGVVALMVASLSFFLPATALAADYKIVGNLRSVADGEHQELNTIKVSAGKGELEAGDKVFLRLPDEFSLNLGAGGWAYSPSGEKVYYGDPGDGCYIYIPWDEENGLNMAADVGGPIPTDIFTVSNLKENEFSITINDGYSIDEDSLFYIYLRDVDVPRGFSGAIELSIDVPPGSGFGEGVVLSGRVGRLESQEEKPAVPPKEDSNEEAAQPEEEGPPLEENGSGPVVFQIGVPSYTSNGVIQSMDSAPYVKDGRTYIPLRYAALALGVDEDEIRWINGSVSLVLNGKNVSLTPGSKVMMVNGEEVSMDAVPETVGGRTMLPIRWLCKALGADVSWDAASQTVTLTK